MSQLYIRWMDVSHAEVISTQLVGTAPTVGVAKPDDQFTCTVLKKDVHSMASAASSGGLYAATSFLPFGRIAVRSAELSSSPIS